MKLQECNHLSTYDIRLVEDSVTSHRTAVCQDEPGSCGRNLCECTVAFAKAMREAEETRYFDDELCIYNYAFIFRSFLLLKNSYSDPLLLPHKECSWKDLSAPHECSTKIARKSHEQFTMSALKIVRLHHECSCF